MKRKENNNKNTINRKKKFEGYNELSQALNHRYFLCG